MAPRFWYTSLNICNFEGLFLRKDSALVMEGAAETHLLSMLAQEGEGHSMLVIYEEDGESEFAGSNDRDEMVQWLCLLTDDLHYRLEVFFRATALLDAFLSLMKVRHKFLECVTATCFYIAAKLEEQSEAVESLLGVLVHQYECVCSGRDIQRMELIVMQKLEFRLSTATPLDFLEMFYKMGMSKGTLSLPQGLSPDHHLCHLALCLETLMCNHLLMKFKPSLLALAVLGCDLKLLGCDWLTAVVTLQTVARIRGGELSVCYEAVVPHYSMAVLRYPMAIRSCSTNQREQSEFVPPEDKFDIPYHSCTDAETGKNLCDMTAVKTAA